MKLVKSLLLGSVAGLAAVAGAQAADLPSKKAAPVEYVRVCSAYGAGFFFIPGTDTCLRVGGRVRAEYRWQEAFGRADNASGFRARGRLNIDARTQTAYGTLRTFFRYELTGNRGVYGAETSVLDKAFIQFAGITAGRAQSFFDFYAHDYDWRADLRASDVTTQNLLAYTATFGGGFSATISIEDQTQRQTAQAGFGNVIAYGGTRMPDIVANLRVDQAWGSAQIAGAVHQLFATNRVPAGLANTGAFVDTEYGFALTGGVKLNLPMLAAGDTLWLQASYSEGALSYVGGAPNNFGGVLIRHADGYVDAFGNVKKTKAYSIAGAFLHYWTPSVRQALFASYARYDYAASVETPVNALGIAPALALRDTSEWKVGSNLIWSPVRDFDIGVEVFYTRVDPKGRQFTNNPNQLGTVTVGHEDQFDVRLRFQRDF